MKRKIISVLISASLSLTPLCSITASAEDSEYSFNISFVDEDSEEYVDDVNAKLIQRAIEWTDEEHYSYIGDENIIYEWNSSESNPFITATFTENWQNYAYSVVVDELPNDYIYHSNKSIEYGISGYLDGEVKVEIKLNEGEVKGNTTLLEGTYSLKLNVMDIVRNEKIGGLDCELFNLQTGEVVAAWNTSETEEMYIENLKYEFDKPDSYNGNITYAIRITNMPENYRFFYGKTRDKYGVSGFGLEEFANGSDLSCTVYLEDTSEDAPKYTYVTTPQGESIVTTTTMTNVQLSDVQSQSINDKQDDNKGDTNCDGAVDMADAVLIMQALANPNKYGICGSAENHLTEQGKLNGDMDGDGLTVGDAQAIQRMLLGLTDTVSESSVMPQIKIYHSASVSDAKYTEMKVDEVVSIETDYNPAMSDWSGIGILLEFKSKDYPITLSTNEGHFTTWDIEEGSGPIENVGKTYNIGNEGYIFWTPDNLHYDENYVSEILIMEEKSEKNNVLGKIVVNQNNQRTLSAVLKEKNDTEVTNNVVENIIAPKIRLYKSNSPEELQYTEMKKGKVVSIETDYDPVMSNWSGIGILLEFESKDYPITLSTNEGHFTTWDKEGGSGIVTNVGQTYDIGNSGYIFWTPDDLSYSEDYESEIMIAGVNNGKCIEVGKIVINMTDEHTLSAVLK